MHLKVNKRDDGRLRFDSHCNYKSFKSCRVSSQSSIHKPLKSLTVPANTQAAIVQVYHKVLHVLEQRTAERFTKLLSLSFAWVDNDEKRNVAIISFHSSCLISVPATVRLVPQHLDEA